MDVVFVDRDEVKNALAEVRKDGSGTDWMAVTYEGPRSQKLKLLGSGGGAVDGLKEKMSDDMVVYAIIRLQEVIDDSVTTKFVFVCFVGSKVGRMQKARISIHRNGVLAELGQSHVQYDCETLDELSSDILMEKISAASGSALHVIDRETGARVTAPMRGPASKAGSAIARRGEDLSKLLFEDEAKCKSSILGVRNDTDPINWAAVFYKDQQTIAPLGTGGGSVDEELLPLLTDDRVCYVLVRKTERIDESDTVKFAFITWTGNNINRMHRAHLVTREEQIKSLFEPFHVSVNCDAHSEISDNILMQLIHRASGTASHVVDTIHTQRIVKGGAAKTESTAPSSEPPAAQVSIPRETSTPSKPSSSSKAPEAEGTPAVEKDPIGFTDRSACLEALLAVRNDSDSTTWALLGFPKGVVKPDTLSFLGSGTGDLEEMYSHLVDDVAAYGLIRRILRVDESDTVKFVFVSWTGLAIARMLRARLGTVSGAIMKLFSPYHVDVVCDSLDEITEDIIRNKIEEAAGVKKHVLDTNS